MKPVLLIDDDRDLLDALFDLFEIYELDNQVETFDGSQKIDTEFLKNRRLIITDLKMPGEDGIGLIQRIPKTSGLDVWVFSGHADKDLSQTLQEMGVSKVLNKPYPIDQLINDITKVLEE